MKFRQAIDNYVMWQRSLGAKFESGARTLNRFCNALTSDIDCDAVSREDVCNFLSGNGVRLTGYRHNKYSTLNGFYRYAINRGYVSQSPLPAPDEEPQRPSAAPPYIFSKDEVRRLLDAIEQTASQRRKLDPDTLQALLLVLYGTGLRISEALNLTLADADLKEQVLTIRDTKFFKSRLVPIGDQLAGVMRTYITLRLRRPLPKDMNSTVFACPDGSALTYGIVRSNFAKLLSAAGIRSADDGRRTPCLHSFRHGFAVNRLTSWYREGADVQRLLPVLATYLGHANLSGTQVYLSMTPELLQQASVRFNHYVNGAHHEQDQ